MWDRTRVGLSSTFKSQVNIGRVHCFLGTDSDIYHLYHRMVEELTSRVTRDGFFRTTRQPPSIHTRGSFQSSCQIYSHKFAYGMSFGSMKKPKRHRKRWLHAVLFHMNGTEFLPRFYTKISFSEGRNRSLPARSSIAHSDIHNRLAQSWSK